MVGGGQRHSRAAVAADRRQARIAAAPARRQGRDRHGAGIEAAEEGGDEIRPRREQQGHALATRARRLQRGADRPGTRVQLRVREPLLGHAGLAVG
jgi:hypothetical protein